MEIKKKRWCLKSFMSFLLILMLFMGFLPAGIFAQENETNSGEQPEIQTEQDAPETAEQDKVPDETPPVSEPSGGIQVYGITPLSGGDGSSANPYIINTAEELADLANDVNNGNTYAGTYFALGNPIDLSGYANWPGIGQQTRPFSGNFNGNGFLVSGLKGTDPNGYGQYGLFGSLNAASIQNFNLQLGGNINAVYDTGAFVGKADNGTQITNCHVDGSGYTINVTGGGRSGGFAGWTNGTAGDATVYFNNCSVTNINTRTSGNYSAGFIGVAHNANLTNCHVTNGSGNKNDGVIYAAGFIGAGHGTTELSNCSVITPNVNGTSAGDSWSGGFAGVLYENAKAAACYAVSPVINGTSCNGGFAGGIYNNADVTSCYVTDPIVNGTHYYQGGFSSKIYDNATVTNSYTAGGKVTQTRRGAAITSYGVGGFVADLYDSASVTNCYSQTDVENNKNGSTDNNSSTGGFAAYIRGDASAKNSYSTGSVFITNNASRPTYQVGGFVSYKSGDGQITNCYSTGAMSTPNSNTYVGGFIGYHTGTGSVSDCFFDTTTTRNHTPVGNKTLSGITAYTTSQMILKENYPATWSVQENFLGKANGSGTDNAPWYIDDDLTYPYLYYQYDGHSKADTNYHIVNTIYQSGHSIGQKRADFNIERDSLPLRTLSSGAVKAYMPYSGTSRHDISTASYTEIPGAVFGTDLHSLGGVSKTNIIAFSSIPHAEKKSDRSVWDVDDENSYTWVGDTVTYYVTVTNNSSEADFKNVTVTDTIHENVRLLEDTITVNPGTAYKEDQAQTLTTDNSVIPYYTYDETTRELVVYLNDMPKQNPDSGEITSYTIAFQVFVEKDAASEFTDRTTYTGDIENTGLLQGKLVYTGPEGEKESDYQYAFTDNNHDPVYDAGLFEFTKTDATTKSPLEGAVFSLYYWTGSGTPSGLVDAGNITTDVTESDKWYRCDGDVSDVNGLVQLQLGKYPTAYAGFYQLVEESAPADYPVPTGQWRLHLNEIAYVDTVTTLQSTGGNAVEALNFETTTETVKGREVIKTASLANQKAAGSVTLKKFNESGNPLPGAAFTIERYDETDSSWKHISYDSGTGQWQDWVSGDYYTQETLLENNIASTVFKQLPVGRYRFKEISAPSGYETLVEPFEGDIPTLDENNNPVYDITFEIRDNQAIQMPVSGDNDNTRMIMLMIGALIALLSVGGGVFKLWNKHKRISVQ
ncbi:SpaA isopeptide-forming pilin-related protein [Eubacterium sp. 1001713B170207_170306_E7]|uniref:SpaA isopeptide-forming pilin-related protein n=1 Tax=Eubacterium sp. 1001713B170207_170306_E7 TaxID=2787097 RepID=UPI001898FAAA|nr:SpaA isopeptide-forming pilin-related protein [Eubacterium sp. 1001713B170207_170306_E7]